MSDLVGKVSAVGGLVGNVRSGALTGSVSPGTGSGGGTSDMAWYPSYNPDTGALSWSRSATIVPPEPANIKGADGADGQDGQDGAPGATGATGPAGADGANGIDGADGITPHIDSTSKHWMLGDVDTGIIAEGINGADGAQGADGQSAYSAAQAGGYTDTEAAFYADLAAMQGLAAELEALL